MTELGILNSVLLPGHTTNVEKSLLYNAPVSSVAKYTLFESTIKFCIDPHSVKADSPIDETELGMEKEINPSQFRNAHFPIEVTELGRVTDVSP